MLTFMGTGCISTTLRRLVSNSEMMSASILSQRGLSGLLQAGNQDYISSQSAASTSSQLPA